jgi:hypothetical protein
MVNTATPVPASASSEQLLVPPEEQFWVRYSPHHEFPLSTITSFALHVLVIGLMLLFAFVLVAARPVHQMPVEAVRFAGGGGNPHGAGDGPGRAAALPVEDGAKPGEDTTPQEKRPGLDLPGPKPLLPADADPKKREVNDRTGPTKGQAITDLKERLARLGPSEKPGAGKGGAGDKGGLGDGHGPGKGPGAGPGDGAKLTQREKRMLRWTMHFKTDTGRDYLAQLAGLGAMIAVPVRETADGSDYELIREPQKKPAKLIKEDLTKLQRIYWFERNTESVRDVMQTLGLTLRPSHFVAFMPEELENTLFKLERDRAGDRAEDDILETHFGVRKEGTRYVPELQSIQFRR